MGVSEGIMVGIAVFECVVGLYQFLLTRKLRDQANAKLREALERQEAEAKETKRRVQHELEAKATKQEVDGLRQSIDQTVQRKVPEVLQEMAQQYASQGSADRQGSSGVDSR